MGYKYIVQSNSLPKLYISKLLPKGYVGSINHWTGVEEEALAFWDQESAQNVQDILEKINIKTTVFRKQEFKNDDDQSRRTQIKLW